MSTNSNQQSDKEKVWEKLSETENDRRFNEIIKHFIALGNTVEEVSGHKKDEK